MLFLSEIEHEGSIPFVQHVQILLHESTFSIYESNLYGGLLILSITISTWFIQVHGFLFIYLFIE